jgi:hypothetical protein
MAGDLATLKSRIASEINRPDLTSQIANAINDAILVYQKERFRFNETIPNAPTTFNTVVGQANYSSVDLADIATMFSLDYMIIQIGSFLQHMTRGDPKHLKVYNQINTMLGQPLWYATEQNQIILSPIPSAIYPVTMGLLRRIAAPATDIEANNPWMIDCERLIRARAKYEIAVHVTRNPTMATAMSPSPPTENGGVVGAAWREFKSLKGEANKIQTLGRMRAMQF